MRCSQAMVRFRNASTRCALRAGGGAGWAAARNSANSMLSICYDFASMAGLLIKELPSDLHRKLKKRAEAHRRSLSSEVITILENALDDRSGPPTLEEIDRLRVRGRRPLTQALIDRARRRDR